MDVFTEEIVRNWNELETLGRNKFVRIHYGRLQEIIRQYPVRLHVSNIMKSAEFFPEDGVAYAARILCGNVWNFHFKDPALPFGTYAVKNFADYSRPFSGSYAMWRKLYEHFSGRVIRAADIHPHVKTTNRMADFFRDVTDIPLPELRQQLGRDYVSGLFRYFLGDPLHLLEEAKSGNFLYAYRGGKGLVELLIEKFPVAFGGDVHTLFGRTYRFLKRARLALFMLHARAREFCSGIADITEVGPIIDYQLPRLYRAWGVLRYSPELEDMIDRQIEIPSGSQAEIEIRAAGTAVCAVWLREEPCLACHLDSHHFTMSRGLGNRAHYTRTSDY